MSTQTLEQQANGNGHADPEHLFPVESLLEAATHLRRPFTTNALRFKVQAAWPKANPTTALCVGYIDARLVVERLNLLVPHLWFDEYEPLQGGLMLCRLTVDGITRQDVGRGQGPESGKAAYSDSLKRAAVKFGVGVSLYAIPKMNLRASDGYVEQKQNAKGEKTLVTTPKGDTRLRDLYLAWLDANGTRAFGDPLDHGDDRDAVGDPEELAQEQGETIGALDEKAVAALRAAYKASGWDAAKLRLQLVAVGAQDVTDVRKALADLTLEQGAALATAMGAS